MRIFHIVAPEVWAAATETGDYRPADFEQDGFVHFSFGHQVSEVANARYRDQPALIAVEIESDDVPAPLRVEDSYGAGQDFPHIYGPIPTHAARAEHPLTRDDAGNWMFTPGPAAGSASSDR